MAQLNKTILLTGYEPFDRFSYNPSGVIALALDGHEVGAGYTVRGAVLPVDCEQMPGLLTDLWEQERPAFVVGLGLAFGETGIRLERLGHNWLAIKSPDNGGHTRPGELITEGAPAAYFSPLPLKEITEALLEKGLPAYLSDHAGTHLCNMLLFTALHRVAQTPGDPTGCGFIHLPGTPELAVHLAQADRTARPGPSLSLDLMQQAVELALNYLAHNAAK